MSYQNKQADNIALTGLMGSGKSSVGRTLARMLKRKFVDTDYLIEQKEGKSINDIFKKEGEEYFRKIEQEVIKKAFKTKGQIISLGGGAVVNDENRKLIKEKSTLIALIAEPEELANRVKKRKNRPLLKDVDQLETLKTLWEERKDAYFDSDIQITTTDKNVDGIANQIIKDLELKKVHSYQTEITIARDNFKYNIHFRKLLQLNLSELNLGRQVLVVTQEPIARNYLDIVKDQLSSQFKVNTLIIEDGEDAKNFFTFQLILQKCLSLKFDRKDTLIALGGGVVGDITGFAASTYYRGINYIQIPTTLLAMIDSSVGGKTAINVPEGKNLIGTFYQPHLVYIDVDNIKTLPDREFRSGLGELVKYTLLGSRWDVLLGESFLSFVSRNAKKIISKNSEILRDTIDHCLKIKSNIVSEDEKEKGLRMHLNLGHTFGHAIEEVTKYKRYSHGEAVAMGTVCACYLAEEIRYIKAADTERVIQLMKELGLEYRIPSDISTEELVSAFNYDKKNIEGKLRFIVPKQKLGRVEVLINPDISIVKRAINRNKA